VPKDLVDPVELRVVRHLLRRVLTLNEMEASTRFRVRIQALTLLKGPQIDDGGDIALNGAHPERLPNRDTVRGRPRLRIPRGPEPLILSCTSCS
jgi:hypothetical protein